VNAKLRELIDELRSVFGARGTLADAAVPPIAFLVLNAILGFAAALVGALLAVLILGSLRIRRHQSLRHLYGGVGAVILAGLSVRLLDGTGAVLLPGLVSGGLTLLACCVSVVVRRPLVALTSHLIRRWPLQWYWHPKVRPAYGEVTLAWALFYAAKLAVQVVAARSAQDGGLATVYVLTGWPATIALLVASYLYGLWRLGNLQGPSVAEFEAGAEPPWEGQKRGF